MRSSESIKIANRCARIEATVSRFTSLPDVARIEVRVVAAMLGVSVPTVWRRVADGQLPRPIRLGRLSRWPVGQIRSILNQCAEVK